MNAEFIDALSAHLAQPDPPEFEPYRRGHRLTQAGKPSRYRLLAVQPNVHAALVRQENEDAVGPRPKLS